MKDHRTFLKVKIKSLAAEAKIIRREEHKNKKLRHLLAEHRREVVRFEARHTLLAYGFLRGRSYKDLEPKSHVAPTWSKVKSMIERYGRSWDGEEPYAQYKADKEQEMKLFEQWCKG